MMDIEGKKLEDEIKEAFLVKKPKVVRQGAYAHTNKLENYHRELVSLLPWLGPHIAKCSDQGSALQIVECVMLITSLEDEDSL